MSTLTPSDEELAAEWVWAPHEGPQTRFLSSAAFELLYGGAAGGGKSEGLVAKATHQVHRPGYRAVLLRSTLTEMPELMDKAGELYPHLDGTYNGYERRWTFPSYDAQGNRIDGKGTIEFGYFEVWKHHRRYRGRQFSFIGWDELGDCPEERFWVFMISRCRSGGPGIMPMLNGTANPGGAGHGWIKRRWVTPCGTDGRRIHREVFKYKWQGEVRAITLTRQYIPSKITDNPTLVENNPMYLAQLMSLPELMRQQLLEGNWEAGEGLAFAEIGERSHLVQPFQVPRHWEIWGAFDWGYSHPWVFGLFACNEDGRVFLIQTIRGRRMRDDEIIERIKSTLAAPVERLQFIAAGHDCWAEIKARQETGITTAERFALAGLPLKQANISRSDGFRQVLDFVSYRGRGGKDAEGKPIDLDPQFVALDTEENVETLENLRAMVIDPDHKGDVLKVDADPLTGKGGDDPYDMVRYGLMERPAPADSALSEQRISAFDREVLKAEVNRQRRVRSMPVYDDQATDRAAAAGF